MNNTLTGLPQLELFFTTLSRNMTASEIAALFFLFSALLRSSLVLSQGLQRGFYDSNCPDAEDIVRSTVKKYYNNDATIAPGLLRLHFHDCFVQVSSIIRFSVLLCGLVLLTFLSIPCSVVLILQLMAKDPVQFCFPVWHLFLLPCTVGMWCFCFDFWSIIWKDCPTEFWSQGIWSDRRCQVPVGGHLPWGGILCWYIGPRRSWFGWSGESLCNYAGLNYVSLAMCWIHAD